MPPASFGDASSAASLAWVQAADDYFAGDSWNDATASPEEAPASVIESPGPITDLALAATGLAFAFNGFGANCDVKAEPRVPRRFPR
jgi:hypothetical protein